MIHITPLPALTVSRAWQDALMREARLTALERAGVITPSERLRASRASRESASAATPGPWPGPVFGDALELLRQDEYWVDRNRLAWLIEEMSLDYVANVIAWLHDNAPYVARSAFEHLDTGWPFHDVRQTDDLGFIQSSPLYAALRARLSAALDGAGSNCYRDES